MMIDKINNFVSQRLHFVPGRKSESTDAPLASFAQEQLTAYMTTAY